MKKNLLKIFAVLMCTVMLFSSCDVISLDLIKDEFSPKTEDGTPKVKAPSFFVYDSLGNKVNFSDFAGKPALLYLWITGLSTIREELEYYDKANREYGDKINFMMIHLTDERFETKEKALTAVTGLTVPVYYDIDKSCAFAYSVNELETFPRTIFIDKDGYIMHDEAGSLSNYNSYLEENIPRLSRGEPYITETPKRCGYCIY